MIEVRIRSNEAKNLQNDWHLELTALHKMRDAGIPVKGMFLYLGIESGILRREDDIETGDIVFQWLG